MSRNRERQRENRRKKHAMERAERSWSGCGYSDPTAYAAIKRADAALAKRRQNCPKP